MFMCVFTIVLVLFLSVFSFQSSYEAAISSVKCSLTRTNRFPPRSATVDSERRDVKQLPSVVRGGCGGKAPTARSAVLRRHDRIKSVSPHLGLALSTDEQTKDSRDFCDGLDAKVECT